MTSNLNKLRNEIKSIEFESDKFIPYNKYYAIEISIPDIEEEKIKEIGRNLILDSSNQPLFTYVNNNSIYVFFSCLDSGSHYFEGSHQYICSIYGSKITKLIELAEDKYVSCKIIEFESQNQVFIYLIWKNTETQFNCISYYLESPLEEVYRNTLQESISILGKKNIVWDELDKFKKFGIIYRLRERKNRIVITSCSKFIDSRKKNKHMEYLFG